MYSMEPFYEKSDYVSRFYTVKSTSLLKRKFNDSKKLHFTISKRAKFFYELKEICFEISKNPFIIVE